MKRIATYEPDKGHAPRELENVSRNEFGDIVLTLDGGEVWQFTPHSSTMEKRIAMLTVANVKNVGKSPRRFQSWLYFEKEHPIMGDIRIIPPGAIQTATPAGNKPQPKKPKTKTKANGRGAPTQYTAKEIRALESAIDANNGSLIDTAKAQSSGDWEARYKVIKLMHDAARKQGLTPKIKRK